jgi:hypothetical protein
MPVTGVEIVGLVLATLPLIISALEHYAEGVHTIKAFRKFEREVGSLIRDLAVEKRVLCNSIELLLQSVVDSEEELESLIEDPGGTLWSDEAFKLRLKKKLQKSYNAYIDKMEDMRDAFDELKKRLHLDATGKVSDCHNSRTKKWN